MRFSQRLLLIALLVAALAGTTTFAKTKFKSVWKSPDASGVVFGGKKVAALIIDKDESLRVSGEETLARELTARGMQGVASYRMVPREELQNADRARVWYEQAGVEGVLTPVSTPPGTHAAGTCRRQVCWSRASALNPIRSSCLCERRRCRDDSPR